MSAARRPPARLPPPLAARLPRFDRFRLGSGIEIVIAEMHDLPIVDVRWLAPGGAATELVGRAGLASLTARLIDQGAGDYAALDLAAAFERLGAHFGAAADWDAAALVLHVLSDRLPDALALLTAVVERPHLDEREFERKRLERLDALLQDEEDPAALASNAFLAAAYPSTHRYALPLAGVPSTVRGLTREDVLAFHRARYRPAGTSLIVVGDVSRDALVPLLESTFGGAASEAVPTATEAAPSADRARVVAWVDRPGAPQSELRIGHAGPPRDTADYFALIVMNTILGGAFTSRLNRRLREAKGYTYGARSRFAFRRGPGPFVAATAVGTEVTAAAIGDTVQELRGLCDARVAEDEIERARNYLALGLPSRLETGAAIADRIAEIVLYGLENDYFDRYTERVLAVSADDVLRVARAHLDPDHLVVAVAGDRARIEDEIEALGLGPITAAGPNAATRDGTRVAPARRPRPPQRSDSDPHPV